MPFKIATGQIDGASFLEFFNKRLSGSNTYLSGFYTHDNTSGFVSLTEGGPNSFTGYSGDIMSRTSGISSQLSGSLDTSGQLLWVKATDVSGHAETFTTSASGYLQTEIETASGQFSSTSGDFLKSGSFYHSGSGDFKASDSITGALAFSSGHDDSFGLFVATGDTNTKVGWMKLPGYPEMTGYVSTSSGDIKNSLNATGAALEASITNVTSNSSSIFSAEKTFSSGIKTEKIALGSDGVTLRVNADKSATFDDISGALLTLAPGYGPDAPVFSVTDKAGLPLIDVYDDDRINLGPYGKNILNLSGQKVIMQNLPAHPNTGGLANGTLYVSGDTTAGGRHLMII
jgi:hypothetical protein